jgi:hypothetical protein
MPRTEPITGALFVARKPRTGVVPGQYRRELTPGKAPVFDGLLQQLPPGSYLLEVFRQPAAPPEHRMVAAERLAAELRTRMLAAMNRQLTGESVEL